MISNGVEKEVVGKNQTVAFIARWNIIKLTEPNTPLNDADHVGSFLFGEEIMLLYFD